jgi:hypothetical protein
MKPHVPATPQIIVKKESKHQATGIMTNSLTALRKSHPQAGYQKQRILLKRF